jgi:uncharacterized protein involved in oxidation of intracellular sulfur
MLPLVRRVQGIARSTPHRLLKELIKQGVTVKVCGACMARCGVHKNQPYFPGAEKSTMAQLATWVVESDRVISF